MSKRVTIDCFPENVQRYSPDYALIVIDVVRATTTAITSVATGRRCFPVADLASAFALAKSLDNPLLVGEQEGRLPIGFAMNNSPSEIASRRDIERAAVLLSSSGTRLCFEAMSRGFHTLVGSLRNYSATARAALQFPAVAIIGAGSRGEFREEDQLCCAWIAERLVAAGYEAPARTLEFIRRWQGQAVDAWINNTSASYLRRSGQTDDLEFILNHIDDLGTTFLLRNGEVLAADNRIEAYA